MITSTFGGYMIAKLGLSASQQGLYLTGQNLTNAGTPGYTRQRLDQVSINYGATYRYASKYEPNIGNGVLVTGTSQLRDPFLDLRYRNEVSQAAEQDVKLGVLNDLRDILDEVKNAGEDSLGDGGIFNQLGDIIEKFEKYTSEIGSKEFDSMVKASCQALVTLFNSYSRQIDEVREDLNFDLQNVDIPRVNQILSDIQQLNKSIRSSEIVGQSALELKDERNLLIDELSQYMKINVTYKPVNVTDSTVIDELHISMVGSNGENYEIIADEQRREFLLSQDGNKTTIGLGALSPVDQELKAELKAAQSALRRAQEAFDNRNQNYKNQHDAFAQVQAKYQSLQDAIDILRTGDTAAADESLRPSFEELEKAKNEASDDYTHKLYVFSKPENYPDEQPPTAEELEAARTKMNEAVSAYNTRKNQIRSAEYDLERYQPTYSSARFDYEKARKNLDETPDFKDPLLQDANGDPLKNLLTGGDLKGEGLAAADLQTAQDRVKKALDALAQADEKGKAVESINELLTDGKLKGTLEMLNYSAEYDDPPNTIRGIGYYQSMLDTLANKFAQTMNQANNPYIRTELAKDKDGRVLYENYTYNPATAQYEANKDAVTGEYIYGKDKDGNPLYEKDKNGQTVYMQDDKGEYILDANGEKIPAPLKIAQKIETTDIRDLFKSRDGNKITAGNIDLADGWVNNSYGITTALNEDDPSGNNTNVLHFINLLNGNLNYKANVNLMDSIKLDFGIGTANTQEPSLMGMQKGDTITIDGKTYTFIPGASGQSGNEFKDFETLKMAAARNGITLTRTPDGPDMEGVITATTATKDLRTETQINGETIGNLSNLNVNRLSYGDTVTIDGQTFTYKPAEYPDGTAFADPSKGEFTTLEDLVKLAGGQNITIATQVSGITTKDADGNPVEISSIDVNGVTTDLKTFDPASIAGMTDGDTIAINGNTYTFVAPPATADPAQGQFSSMDDLAAAASNNGIQISTGVTEITKTPGATLPVSVDKAPSIQNMTTGNSLTVDGKTFTYVDPKEVKDIVDAGTVPAEIEINGQKFTYVKPDDTVTPPVVADPAKGEFSDMDTLVAAAAAATPPMTLFSDADSLTAAAEKQGLDIHVNPDTMEITTATRPGSNIFDGTFEEYYVSLSATLGLDIKSTAERAETHVMLAGSISDEREAVTGVSHDEEAMNLMRYQQAYTASSRLLTTMDQVLDILLTQTGMVGR